MNNATLNRIHEGLRNNHLCCLIGDPLEGDTYETAGIHEDFYNNGFVVICLDIDTDVNPTTSRAASTQGWYETFFNLILGQLQRSSFSVTTQQRREIRTQSQLIINNLNPFQEFYRILEDIASTQQRSFLLHFTEIQCLEDPASNLSERDVRFFLEAIDSYCSRFLTPSESNPIADQSQPRLSFLLEGSKFPKSEKLNDPQVLGQSIIDLNPSANVPVSDINSPQETTGEPEAIEFIVEKESLDLDLNSLPIDDKKDANNRTNFIEESTINSTTSTLTSDPVISSTQSETIVPDTTTKTNNAWLGRLSLVALGFIGSALFLPVILSQPQVQVWLNISPTPTPNLNPSLTSPPIESDESQITSSPDPVIQTPTPDPTPTPTPDPAPTPTPTSTPIFSKESFPKATCGDSLPSNITEYPVSFYPVFVDPGSRNLQTVTTVFCRDAYEMTKKDTGNKAIQVASFLTRERAQSFADLLKREMGSGEVGPPTILESPRSGSQGNALSVSYNSVREEDAIALVETLYSLLSERKFVQASNLYGSELDNKFDPDFFRQFDRVTVSDLYITSKANSSIKLEGTTTYIWIDGSTQREIRNYTIRLVDNDLKITASEFVRVIQSR